jgi:hypothetical protein
MDFQKWYTEQWFPIYHPLVSKVREIVQDVSVLSQRLTSLWTEFQSFRKDMYGNGQKGYVERVVRERTDELKEDFRVMIHEAINAAFATYKTEQDKTTEKTREKWDGRTWAVVLIVIQLVFGAAQAYWIWKVTQ